ncbi:hypothetical protein AB9P05_07685 [Roseivirga sp. BDSF3-8]|uniref:hypothetical protein n=1 Tax=Roseivirga sp. BDSF3-8 TaxID=3241598 RepID=UPI0035318893
MNEVSISPEEFKRLLANNELDSSLEKWAAEGKERLNVHGNIIINAPEYFQHINGVKLPIYIIGSLGYNGLNIACDLMLNNVTIKERLLFSECQFTSDIVSINVIGLSANELLIMAPFKSQCLTFNECQLGAFGLLGLEVSLLKVMDTKIDGHTTMLNSSIDEFVLTSSYFKGQINISESRISLGKLNKCEFERDVQISEVTLHYLGVISCSCKGAFILEEVIAAYIFLVENTIEGQSKLTYSEQLDLGQYIAPALPLEKIQTELKLIGNTLNKGFKVLGRDGNFNLITIHGHGAAMNVVEFEECNSLSLAISGVIQSTILSFNYCRFGWVGYNKVNNHGKIIFNGLFTFTPEEVKRLFNKPDYEASHFEALRSELGDTRFFLVDFTIFDEIIISKSSFDGVSARHTTWFTEDKLRFPSTDESEQAQKYNLYQELKKMAERAGNDVQAREFRRIELDAHRQDLKARKVSRFNNDRFTLWFNRVTNRHNASWKRPLAILLIMATLFYSGFVAIHYFNRCGNWVNSLYSYPYFLFPLRSLDTFNTCEGLLWLAPVYHLYRLLYALIAYQLVTAFRKFGKK